MSIISEALKKAQHKGKKGMLKEKAPERPVLTEKPAAEKEKPKKIESRARVFILTGVGVLLMIFLIAGFVLIYGMGKVTQLVVDVREQIVSPPVAEVDGPESEETALKETVEEAAAPVAQKFANFEPANKTSPSPDFKIELSGIMYSPKNPLAVINNRIMKEGEEVGPFKILQIKPDRVKLTDGGKEIELLLSR